MFYIANNNSISLYKLSQWVRIVLTSKLYPLRIELVSGHSATNLPGSPITPLSRGSYAWAGVG